MEKHILDTIVETVEGYEVKELRYKKVDNILVGRVKCPVLGRENLHNGFVSCCWRVNGTLHHRYGGTTRPDLYLKIIR